MATAMNEISSTKPPKDAPATVVQWVNEVAALTRPARIHWCDGSEAEQGALRGQLIQSGELLPLNEKTFPGCYLYRSSPNDVARVEHVTFVCTRNHADAGPNNHWMAPAEAHAKMDALFAGCMQGRTLYVVPYCMGPVDSPYSRVGVEITDSAYVVLNMATMTRMGSGVLARIAKDGSFVRGLHSTGDLSPDRRFIMHFPRNSGSRASVPATAATRCWARSAMRCASRAGRPATRAGWPSTCSSWAWKAPRARPTTSRPRSRPPAARPTSRC